VIGRRLAVAAVAALAAIPFAGAMAASPGPAELPNALANPLEASFVEVTSSRADDLVGWFDAARFANWAGSTADARQYYREMLTSNRFVSGYQREWYVPQQSDAMYETAFVFQKADGALSMLSTEKSTFSNFDAFKSWVPTDLNDSAFALQEITEGYHWTVVSFAKGNDVFELFRGSDSDYQTAAGLAQAREMYTVAPNGTTLGPQGQRQQSALSRYIVPVMITFVLGAVLITTALVIAVVVALTSRPTPAEVRP
jgi:hypothetical protein